ncbi:MAG: amidohydrolase [Clostridiaceae bacterium]|jgi:amidohydrolase|nr:M20 family metallopeptidase [Eubacteriales bacterium]NLV47770.1 amidohydrolase [Clostridiaceae bacterium]
MKFSEKDIDKGTIIALRRELHQYPELAFDLPRTIALVKRELDKLGISYTEKFGKSSVVATINPEKDHFTIGIRADMDALPLEERRESDYQSKVPGKMHACGHDAHTAMLLGTAKALQAMKDQISCRIKLLFQPSEEGYQSGAELMVRDGVMDDIDIIIGQHVELALDSGKVGVCPGYSMPASRTVKIQLSGKPAHATQPQKGIDAIAMAFRIYGSVQLMVAREMDPLARFVCSFNKISGGQTQNIIAESAELLGTIRSYEAEHDTYLLDRITSIANNTASEIGGQVQLQSNLKCLPVYNDRKLSESWTQSAIKLLGSDRVEPMAMKMGSEDFSHYLTKKPGIFFRIGVRNEARGITVSPHNGYFDVDEDALPVGSAMCVQFVLDHMDGKVETEAVAAVGYRLNEIEEPIL